MQHLRGWYEIRQCSWEFELRCLCARILFITGGRGVVVHRVCCWLLFKPLSSYHLPAVRIWDSFGAVPGQHGMPAVPGGNIRQLAGTDYVLAVCRAVRARADLSQGQLHVTVQPRVLRVQQTRVPCQPDKQHLALHGRRSLCVRRMPQAR